MFEIFERKLLPIHIDANNTSRSLMLYGLKSLSCWVLEVLSEFNWFDHTYSHIQAHKFTDVNDIIREFQKNKAFAQVSASSIISLLIT